jgi:hypothetical protein
MTADDRNPDAEPRFEYTHIEGNEQLQKLAKETFKLAFSAESARIQEVQEQIAERHRNVKKLSTALHRAWLRQVAEQRSTGFRGMPPTALNFLVLHADFIVRLSSSCFAFVACDAAQSTKQKEEAATKIQAAARGRFARRKAKTIQAEKVCFDALFRTREWRKQTLIFALVSAHHASTRQLAERAARVPERCWGLF